MSGSTTLSAPPSREYPANELRPGDRIRRDNAMWIVTRVAVTHERPVSVRLRQVGLASAPEIEIELAADEIVGVR